MILPGKPIDSRKPKTNIGDPGWYYSRKHEIFQPNSPNKVGIFFNSALPQRPIAVNHRGEPATLPWQVWSGYDDRGR